MSCGDNAAFANTVLETIQGCILEKDIVVEKLPMYIIDYIYLNLRCKSVSEDVEAAYVCNNPVNAGDGETKPCGTKIPVTINLSSAEVFFPRDFNKNTVIELSEGMGIKLRSPSFKQFLMAQTNNDVFDLTDEYIYSCVECVYHGEDVLMPEKDFNLAELKEFIDSVSAKVVNNLTNFFTKQPVIGLDINIKCPSCGHKEKIELRGIDDFFE